MTTDELLRQILADPTDAALRSVYADALLGAGDPRGELIAVESALDRPGALERRVALRAAHAQQWWGRPAHQVRSERGFAVAIATTGELEDVEWCFGREPVEEIELTRLQDQNLLPGHLVAVAPGLRRLALRGSFGAGALLSLIRRPFTEVLESLDVTGALHRVAPLEELPNLRRLVVARCPLGRTLTTLLRWEHLGKLTELDVRSCALDAWTLDELLALDLRSLRVLKLSGNPLGEHGTRVLQQRLRHLPRLERLELIDCDVTDITHLGIMEREDLPASVELVGADLELLPTAPGRYGLLVDGVRRRLRFRSVRTEDGLPETVVSDWTEGDDAPLEPLFHAIALGLPCRTTPTGAILQLAFAVAEAYTTTISIRDTLEVRFATDVVTLELERHMMTDA